MTSTHASNPADLGSGDAEAAAPTASRWRVVDTWGKPRLAWYGVGMVALVTVFGQLDRGIMALLVQSIKKDTGMSDTEISLLMGLAYSLVYMCVGLPMARVADVGRRTFILPGALAVWSLGTALCGLAQSFWSFFLFRGLVGGGEAVKGPTSTSLFPDFVPREKLARAFGIYNIAISFGEAGALIIGGLLIGWTMTLAPIHLAGVGDLHGWRMVYLIFGLPGILLALFFVATVPEPMRHGRRRAAGSVPIKEVVLFLVKGPSSKVFIPLFISAVVASVYSLGVGAWRPTFYQRTYGLTPAEYGPISGMASLITAPLGVLIGTFVVERMRKRWDDAYLRIVLYADIVAVPIAIAAPLMPTFPLAVMCQVFSSILLMMGAPSRMAATQLIVPNEMRAQINAIFMFTVGVVGTGLGPTVVALVTDYVFQDESQLRYAIMLSAAVATPISPLCIWWALKSYAPLYRQAQAQQS